MTEIQLLEKELKFTPTSRNSNIPELTKDISEFTRKIRLIEFCVGCEDKDESLVRNKSNFVILFHHKGEKNFWTILF